MSLTRKAGDLATSDSKKPKANGSITSFFGAPKAVSTTKVTGASTEATPAVPAPVSKFDKDKWVATLTPEQKDLLKLEIETLHESWLKELKDEVISKEFLELKRYLKREQEAGKKIFPPMADVYSWSVLFSSHLRFPDPSSPCHPLLTIFDKGLDIHH
jgi:uracil-DNA glycosylase